jgi:hypothetical protein
MSILQLSIMLAACGVGQAEQMDADRQAEVAAWRRGLAAMAEEHRLSAADPAAEAFHRVERPVFQWSQPVRHGQIGAVYLWLERDGRPAALGTIFAWRLPPQPWEVMHEFHSLSLQPLQLNFRGRTVWAPTEPGLQWQPFADDTEVATSQQRQSAQIRQLARQFRAHTVTLEKDKWELRLISRPLHEYATGEGESIQCGAVFAMSQGTDPELILVIEAHAAEKGTHWQYACCAFTDYEIHCAYRDHEIWNAPATPHGTVFAPDKRYWREFITRDASTPQLEPEPTEEKK